MLSHITSRLSLAFQKFRENPKPALRFMGHQIREDALRLVAFLKSCYIDGTKALIAGKYDRKQAAVIIAGNLPTILGALLITVPSILFPSPGHQAFYHFGNTLGEDPACLIPVALGAVSSTLGLRVPLT